MTHRSGSGGSGTSQVLFIALLWAGLLILLAYLWIQSPFSGPGPMFVSWSLAAIPLTLWSWSRFRTWEIHQLPRNTTFIVGLGLIWLGAIALSGASFPGVMAMDGLVLRDNTLRLTGILLRWTPGLFGLFFSVAGLVAALEARYRLAHRGQPDGESPTR